MVTWSPFDDQRLYSNHLVTAREIAMEFKEKLKQIREETGLSIKKISELSGLNHQVLKNYSAGLRNPKRETIDKLLAVPELAKYKYLLLLGDTDTENNELESAIAEARALGISTATLAEYLRSQLSHLAEKDTNEGGNE